MSERLIDVGWDKFDADPNLISWLDTAEPAARATLTDTDHAHWHRCAGTWFAGVNVLPNDADGAVKGGPPLTGRAVDAAQRHVGTPFDWDRAQVSVVYPGYPKPRDDESAASFRFRRDRDAAHVDGLLPVGPARRRFLREHHRFILGIPVGPADARAAPLVVWEGSHHIIREALTTFYGAASPEDWRDMDVTDVYHAARRRVFDECRRVSVSAGRGEAYLVHRLALHGIAPWLDGASVTERMVIYFRPESGDPEAWLKVP